MLKQAMRIGLLLLPGLLLGPLAAAGDEAPVVAVFEIENRGAPLSDAERLSLTDYLASRLGRGGRFQIIPRQAIRERLRAQQIDSHRKCYDQRCQIDIGRELAAELTVSATIARVGGQCLLNAALYDLRRAATLRTASRRAACDADALVSAVEALADELQGRAAEPAAAAPPRPEPEPAAAPAAQPEPQSEPQPPGKSVGLALAWSLLPGGGLYYTGDWGWGIVYSLLIIAPTAIVLGGWDTFDYNVAAPAGFGTSLGFYIISFTHAGIAAGNWEPEPDTAAGGAAGHGRHRDALQPGQPARPAQPAVIFPLAGGRF
jgi:hypothetical protein